MYQFYWIPHIYYQAFSAAGKLVIKADGLMFRLDVVFGWTAEVYVAAKHVDNWLYLVVYS